MRPGFSLVEIIIALAISGFVMTIVFNTISLLQRSSKNYNELITIDSQQELLFGQLQKDISGMVIPLFGFVANSKQKSEEQQKKQEEYNARFGLQIEIEQERLKSLSFVTTSVLASYGTTKPRLARVRYMLLTEPAQPASFMLIRQESSELALADFEADMQKNSNGSYTIGTGFKTCAISCIIISQKDDKKKVEEVSSWSFAEQIKKQQSENSAGQRVEKKIELPQIITLKGSLIDETSGHEYAFDYSFFVPLDTRVSKKQEQKPEEKAPEGKPKTSQAPSAPGMGATKPMVNLPKFNFPTGMKK